MPIESIYPAGYCYDRPVEVSKFADALFSNFLFYGARKVGLK